MIRINSGPLTAETTFTFCTLFILLLWIPLSLSPAIFVFSAGAFGTTKAQFSIPLVCTVFPSDNLEVYSTRKLQVFSRLLILSKKDWKTFVKSHFYCFIKTITCFLWNIIHLWCGSVPNAHANVKFSSYPYTVEYCKGNILFKIFVVT